MESRCYCIPHLWPGTLKAWHAKWYRCPHCHRAFPCRGKISWNMAENEREIAQCVAAYVTFRMSLDLCTGRAWHAMPPPVKCATRESNKTPGIHALFADINFLPCKWVDQHRLAPVCACLTYDNAGPITWKWVASLNCTQSMKGAWLIGEPTSGRILFTLRHSVQHCATRPLVKPQLISHLFLFIQQPSSFIYVCMDGFLYIWMDGCMFVCMYISIYAAVCIIKGPWAPWWVFAVVVFPRICRSH